MTKTMTEMVGRGALVAGLFAAAAQLHAQTPAAPQKLDGRELFTEHCASCHGPTGEGNGPAASSLRQRPADLTKYATVNGGVFPEMKLRRIIDGRDVMAHGSRDMPIWGRVFRKSPDGVNDDAAISARIDAIVRYVESIQARRSH